MANKTKKYVKGSAKEVVFDDGSSLINADLNLADLNSLNVSASGYVKITIARRREVDSYGNTHSVYENTFKSDGAKKGAGAPLGEPVSKPFPPTTRPFEDSPFS